MLNGGLRKARIKPVFAALIGIGVSDCVRVPAADPITSGPSVDLVVRRIKCDLVEALEPAILEDKNYTWLQTWVAQASLTAIVNDASTLTPGATLTHPLTMVSIPGRVTNFSQSFNLGLGAGLNTTASRNETITFSMSLREIKDESHDAHFCDYPDLTDLHSELGLRQWIYAALSPAQWGDLTPGHHKASKSGTTPSSGAGGGAAAAAAGGVAPAAAAAQLYTLDLVKPSFSKLIPPNLCPKPGVSKKPKTSQDRITILQQDIDCILADIQTSEIDDPVTVIATSVSNITPLQGSTLGHTPVTIIGANFNNLAVDARGYVKDTNKVTFGGPTNKVTFGGPTNKVTFGGLEAIKAKVVNDSTICALTPPHPAPTAVDVAVIAAVNASEVAGTKIGGFTYKDPKAALAGSYIQPAIALISDIGLIKREQSITITTKNIVLTKVTTVTINGVPATNISKTQDNIYTTIPQGTITATIPPTANSGVVDVVVVMSDGTPNASASFTFYDPNNLTCMPQAAGKKKIIAYVDQRLDKKIDTALFKTRQLIDLVEEARLQSGANEKRLNEILQTTKAVQDALLTMELDPPLDAIGHQVQFMIVNTASVSPSWTLVNFKGPSPATGSGASATKTLTHTLNIAMGPPGSPDVANTLGALQIGTAIGNSLGVSGVTIPP